MINSMKRFLQINKYTQPTSLLDWRIDSVTEVSTWVIKHFSLKQNYNDTVTGRVAEPDG